MDETKKKTPPSGLSSCQKTLKSNGKSDVAAWIAKYPHCWQTHLERLDVCTFVNQDFFLSKHTLRWLKSTVVQDLKQVVNTLSNSDRPFSRFTFMNGDRTQVNEIMKGIISQCKNEGESLELDPNKPSNTRERVKSRVIGRTRWMNSFWCLSLLPSQPANWHTFKSSVAGRAARSAWESVGGRMGRMEREKESVSQHQKAILVDQGECIHSSMCCFVMMPNSAIQQHLQCL